MAVPAQGFKTCPKCKTGTVIDAVTCMKCGHIFRTQFNQNGPQNPPTSPTMGFYTNPQGWPGIGQQGAQPPGGQMPPGFYQPNAIQQRDLIQLLPGSHSTFMAGLLSFLICGAGQLYNRQTGKGILLFAMCVVFAALCITWPLIPVVWIVGLIDACLVASRLNRGQVITSWQFF